MHYLMILISILISQAALANDADTQKKEAARQIIQGFGSDLKHTLISSMKTQGPVAAITACNISAPAIASQHSQTPWQISRSSLKIRNPNNSADAWLQQVLMSLEQRKENGEAISQLEYSEHRSDGWYFVKAIATTEPCLACHGEKVLPAVKEKLAELYPNDQATGFKLGDIRGVFVVKQETFKH